jgi:hypothetical protein
MMPAARETIGANEVKRSVKASPLICANAVVLNKPKSTMEKTPSLSFNPHLLPAAGCSDSQPAASFRGSFFPSFFPWSVLFCSLPWSK